MHTTGNHLLSVIQAATNTRRRHRVVVEDLIESLQYDHDGWLLAIGRQVGADGPDGIGRSSGCEDDQSYGPNRGQVITLPTDAPTCSLSTW